MDWKETINMLSSRTLQLLAEQHRHLQQGNNRESELESTEDPLAFLLQEDYLNALWHDFSHQEKSVLYYFVFAVRDGVLSHRRAEQGIPGMSLIDFRLGLTLLRRKGIIYTVRRLWGELGYSIPLEMAEMWRELLLSHFPSANREEQQGSSLQAGHWRSSPFIYPYPSLVRDLFQVLVEIRERPLTLTTGGAVQRRRLKQVMALISLTEETFRELGIAYERHRSYSPLEAVLLDVLLRLRLLTREPEKWSVDLKVAAEWLGQPPAQLTKQLFALLRSNVLPADPVWQTAIDLMFLGGNTQAGAESGKLGGNYSFSATIQYIRNHPWLHFVLDNGEKAELTDVNQFYARLIRPLMEAGFLHAVREEEDIRWQWIPALVEKTETRPEQLPAGKFYVQADFTVSVPPEVPLSVEWALATFAEMRTVDGITLYSLNKQSVERALSAGMKMEEIILCLESYSMTPLAAHLVDTLWRWAEEHGRVSWEDVRLLRCADKRIADELTSVPALAELLGERVNDRDFIVSPNHWNSLVEAMEARGYPSPRRKNAFAEGQAKTTTTNHLEDTAIRLILREPETTGYKVENVFPDLEDVFPGLNEIPHMWWKNFQGYHESTLRDLIQRAIRMGAPLRVLPRFAAMAGEGAQELFFVPERLVNENGFWMVRGTEEKKEIRMKTEEIARIQISLPEWM